jgi:hypothetical protein
MTAPLAVNATGGEIEALWKDYVAAEKRLQFDLSKLISDKRPELGGVARLQRDQHFATIEMRNMKFQYLLENDPERLVLDEGLSELANLEWTEEDAEALRASNPDFAVLERWVKINGERLSEHPKLPATARCVEELHREEHYRSMIERFELRMDDLETTLALLARKAKRTRRSSPTETMESPDSD